MSEVSSSPSCVHAGPRPERLDKIAALRFGELGLSRERLKKLILAGQCTVDGVACTDPAHKVMAGQTVCVAVPAAASELVPEEGALHIVYQDDQLLVLNKPAGMTVHPAPSCPEGTLVHRLLTHCPGLRAQEGWRPGIVHRLDKDTSGLIVVAPDEAARLALAKAFAQREVDKTYLALVAGVLNPQSGACLEPLGRHPTQKIKMAVVRDGRPAHTTWETLYVDPRRRFSLLAVQLHTGRTHQIRVHMAHLGHPLLGDSTYAPRDVAAMAPRQMLHAWKLAFVHPVSGERLASVCPPPEDMVQTMLGLTAHGTHVVVTGLPGCGKSLLTRLLGEQGLPVWSADDAVRQTYEPGQDGWLILNHRFRGRFTSPGKPVDKAKLAAALQEMPGMREELEALIHPLINAALQDFWTCADADGHPLAVAEVPLWLEMGASKPKYGPALGPVTLVGVHCDAALRHERLHTLRHWPLSMITAADSWQWPEKAKMEACDMVISNNGTPEELTIQTQRLTASLLEHHARLTAARRQQWERLWE